MSADAWLMVIEQVHMAQRKFCPAVAHKRSVF
jgi:hypothetical protein